MMGWEIKHRFTGEPIYTAEIDCPEDTPESVKLGLATIAAVQARASLRWANLTKADLREADLHAADLREADMSHANLSGADLSYANLRWADMSHANLSGADLSYANLRWADLSYADLTKANLSHAYLTDAVLTGAIGILSLPIAEPRNYRHVAVWHGEWIIFAGCRRYTIPQARKHWLSDKYNGPASVRDTYGAALDWLEKQEGRNEKT